jgi:glycosyltransferase involved in cell wall biosynthesis
MISVLIPAYNEAERIGATLEAARALPFLREIIVIDDGSADNTAQIAESSGADIVFRQPHAGKGAALNRGRRLAQGSVMLLLDADLGASAREATKLLEPVLTGSADMTIATFPVLSGKKGGMGLVVRQARNGIRALTGRVMQAPLSGQRAIRREVLEDIGGFAEGWGVEVHLTVKALRAGFKVLEIPTQMTHRVTGRRPADILHRVRQFVAVVRVLRQLRAEGASDAGP